MIIKKAKSTTPYPSQINTKTISCRISATDYVKFLEDALPAFRLFESEYLLLQKIYADFFPELKEFAQTRMRELSVV